MPENEEIKNDTAEKGSGTQPDTSALFDLLGKLLATEAAGQASGQNNGDRSSTDKSEQSRPAGQFGAAEPNTQKNSVSGDLLSSLLSNPDLLSKLPQILSVMGPLLGGLGGGQRNDGGEREAVKTSAPASAPTSKSSKDADCRAALLCAMKPYLGRERQDAIDYMIKLSRLGDILKTL